MNFTPKHDSVNLQRGKHISRYDLLKTVSSNIIFFNVYVIFLERDGPTRFNGPRHFTSAPQRFLLELSVKYKPSQYVIFGGYTCFNRHLLCFSSMIILSTRVGFSNVSNKDILINSLERAKTISLKNTVVYSNMRIY